MLTIGRIMKDPKRIDRILAQIKRVWAAHPELRLGQLLCVVRSDFEEGPFHYEDKLLEAALESFGTQRAADPLPTDVEYLAIINDLSQRLEQAEETRNACQVENSRLALENQSLREKRKVRA